MTFYEKVLIEYEANIENTGKPFLCNNSETFFTIWSGIDNLRKKETLIEHATNFIDSIDSIQYGVGVGTVYLFYTDKTSFEQKKKLRIDFLEWSIKNNLDI